MEELTQRWPEPVKNPFQAIIFDWDGTAVMSRTEPVPELIHVLERTLREGIILAIITGTKIENLSNQVLEHLGTEAKKNLYVCTNRGSEVYGFSESGTAKLIFRKEATSDENRKLDEIATSLERYLHTKGGLVTKVISNRLNRRKIDLIPLPSWESPLKSEMKQLLAAVTMRLEEAGFSGGIGDIVAKSHELAGGKGPSGRPYHLGHQAPRNRAHR